MKVLEEGTKPRPEILMGGASWEMRLIAGHYAGVFTRHLASATIGTEKIEVMSA
jgi:hypothetical protein